MAWMSREWNIIDALFLVCSLSGFILHIASQWVDVMRLSIGFYAFGAFLLYTEALRISAISPYLGPLLVMIRKMVSQ